MQKRLNKVSSSSKLLLWPSSFKFFVRNFATVRFDCWDGKSWISSSRETHHLSFFTFMKDNCPEAKAWIKKLKPTRVQIFFLLFHQKSAKKIFEHLLLVFLRGWKNFPSWFSLKFLDEPSRENINHFESTIGKQTRMAKKRFWEVI